MVTLYFDLFNLTILGGDGKEKDGEKLLDYCSQTGIVPFMEWVSQTALDRVPVLLGYPS